MTTVDARSERLTRGRIDHISRMSIDVAFGDQVRAAHIIVRRRRRRREHIVGHHVNEAQNELSFHIFDVLLLRERVGVR